MLDFIIKGYVAFCLFVQTETIIRITYNDILQRDMKTRDKLLSILMLCLVLVVFFSFIGLLLSILINLFS